MPFEFEEKQHLSSSFSLDVHFRSEANVLALVGPSGSGKSTILEIMAGARVARAGHFVSGERLFHDTRNGTSVSIQARNVGMVFQDLLLWPHLSVEGNLRYPKGRAKQGGVDFDDVVELIELGGLLGRYPASLSGGERQRVALGRALLSSPDLLLLDEPLVALDERLRHRILKYVEQVIGHWLIPTILVSHVLDDVRRLAEDVVMLDQGRVVGQGPPDLLLHRQPENR